MFFSEEASDIVQLQISNNNSLRAIIITLKHEVWYYLEKWLEIEILRKFGQNLLKQLDYSNSIFRGREKGCRLLIEF